MMAKKVVGRRVGPWATRSDGSHRIFDVDGETTRNLKRETRNLLFVGWHRQVSPRAWGWFLSLTICLFCPNLFALNGDMGGATQDGSAEFPWLIQDLLDFHEFTEDPNYWDDHTRLECDPNLAGITYTTAVFAPDTDSSGFYFEGTPFTGVFDGNGHAIFNLTIDTAGEESGFLGLIGQIDDPNAQIENLGLENISITGGDYSYLVGGLCGKKYDGSISNCYVSGSVASGDFSSLISGLCGQNIYGTINNCYFTGSVTAGNSFLVLGGFCGQNFNGSINKCYSIVSVTGGYASKYLGGLCGSNYGSISNCYSSGSVDNEISNSFIGDLCGNNGWSGFISNCYASCTISGGDIPGGLCGYNSGGSISACYFLDTAGLDNGFGIPLADPNMRIQSSFVGWDFVGEENNGFDDIWRMCVDGFEYPKLYWQFHPADFTCPDGVEMLDLRYFCNHWLAEGDDLRCDIAPFPNPDGVVNLFDYIEFSRYWLFETEP